jgi:putative ABC transport system substrate-binding protein
MRRTECGGAAVSGMRRRQFIGLLGSAAAWPIAARAQQPAMPVIGFMSARSPEDTVQELNAFYKGLGEGGIIDHDNASIEYRWARGDYARLPALAAELVQRRVNVLVATGGDASARAAKAATATIPVVFNMGSDPVKAGLVESFNRPGGNVTGCVILSESMEQKRFGLLRDIIPAVTLYGAIINPSYPAAAGQLRDIETAAPQLGKRVFVAKASNDAELDAAFAALLRERVGALLVGSDPYFDTRRRAIIAFAAQNRLPAIYQFRQYAVEGGLISYGPSITDAYRQVGIYTARILKGAVPADLPVMQPTKFDFVINLKTAKVLGLEIPPTVVARADEVIE